MWSMFDRLIGCDMSKEELIKESKFLDTKQLYKLLIEQPISPF